MSICIITGDVNPDHLVKVAKSLHYKLTIFSSIINIIWEGILRLCKHSVSHHTFVH